MRTLICFFLLSALSIEAAVYIVPFRGCDIRQLFFDNSLRDEIGKPFMRLREALEERGYEVGFTENCRGLEDVEAIISFECHSELLQGISEYPKEKCFLFNFEPPVVLQRAYDRGLFSYFGKIFVLFDEMEALGFSKFHYPQPRFQMVKNLTPFSERKLSVMIAGNKDSHHPQSLYQERRSAIIFFEALYRSGQADDFDLYGFGWEGWPLWKGQIANKSDVYKNYKFSICYENMGNQKGYITEKIFDSFIGGCIPVYLGADNIGEYVPAECFIDRRKFSSNEELYSFLKQMDEETHANYLKAIKTYLESPESFLFTIEHFIDTVMRNLD